MWQRHFYDGIASALPGTVLAADVDFAWARPAARAPVGPWPARATTSEGVWDQIRAAHAQRPLDAVISYCFSADVEPALVERTIALGIPWINFFCDSTYAFDLVASLARITSLNWFPEGMATPSYQAAGRPFLCRPYAVNPDALPDATCETADHALGFVGAPTGNRVLRLAALRFRGCRVTVRGEGWDRVGRPPLRGDRRMRGSLAEGLLVWALARAVRGDATPLTDEEMAPFLARCRVVLGLNEGRNLAGTYQSYLKLRDVEFPGYGCCYLTQHNDDLAHAFDVGREALTFRDSAEAAALTRRCAQHPDEARAIGRAARQRVHAEHSWAARLRELAAAL